MSPRTLPAEIRKLYPFASKFIKLENELSMHYIDEGENSNDTLVMLHGNPSWSFYYRRLIEHFRKNHRVIAPDHIGMGLSDKPQNYNYTLKNHIDNLNKLLGKILHENEQVTLLVHDWGGAIGMGWAVENCERIKRIVVFNTAAFLSERIPLRIDICRIPGFGALAIRGFNAFAGAATSMAVTKPMSPEIKDGFLYPYDNWQNRIATLRFVQDIPLHPGIISYDTMSNIDRKLALLKDKPMLIQWGGKDWCFNDSFYDEWKKRFPEAEVDYYKNAGHYVIEDAYEEIIPKLETFFSK